MILIISICKEKLHELEFLKPIEDILQDSNMKYFVKHYKNVNDNDLNKSDKIIICGTSLKDDEFLEDFEKFSWIKDCEKLIFGICGGMQIISLVFGGKLKKKQEIGFFIENFKKEFLSFEGEQQVYHLHNKYVTLPKDFEKFTSSDIPQAVKHKTKPIYGVLFHPEVRNKEMVENFCRL